LTAFIGGPLRNISREELAEHNTKFDCWTALNGKVYNITQYIDYHPGGVPKLMLGAGKDCTALFNRYHAWVNYESMLSKCLVGVLSEGSGTIQEDEEEEEEDEQEKRVANLKEAAQSILEDKADEK
jgi:cytochrome b involved in lipid metabolism